MTDYYFDGTNGNDTTGAGTEANPYKTIKPSTIGGAFNPSNARFFIKRGTSVYIAVSVIHPQGSFYIGPYGSGAEAAKLIYNYLGSYYLAVGTSATSADEIVFDSTTLIDNEPTSSVSGVYQNDAGSGTIIVKDCVIDGFYNGIMTQRGTGHQLLRNQITNTRGCGIKIEHVSVAAPSNMLIEDNYADNRHGTDDCIVLHSGASNGYGNVIRRNTCITGGEQGIDIMQQFLGTMVYRNVIYSSQAPLSSGWQDLFCRGAYSVIERNLIFAANRCAMQFDAVGIIARCNVIVGAEGLAGGHQMQALGTATNFQAYNNLFYMASGFANVALIANSPLTTGKAKNNIFINNSSVSSSRFIAAEVFANLGTWDIDNNYYVQLPGSYSTPWAGARTFEQWIATTGTPDAGTGIVATSSPLQLPSFRQLGDAIDVTKIFTIDENSPLVGVGAHVGYSHDINRKYFWNPPAIGPIEYMRPRTARDPFFFSLTAAMFYAPLTSTLALTNGTGSATFTRATAAWDFNDKGKLYKVPSGAVRMRGCRPVINQYTGNTDNLTGLPAGRITNVDSAATDSDGTTKAGTWRLDASAGEHYLRSQSSAFEGKYVNIAFKIKLTSYRYVALRIGSWYNFYDLQTQSWIGTLQGSSRDAIVSGDWVLLEMTGGPIPSGSLVFSLLFTSAAWDVSWTPLGTEEVIVYQAMMSDVTGDTDKTFSDYVAGNTSYGAGANGVKYFATYKDGTPIPEETMLGVGLNPNAITNTLLYCRDLTNAAWVKTNTTAALTQTGIDGQANACSLLTATSANGTALQTITAAAASGCSGFYVKRSVGTGSVYITRDGGTSWADITSQINSTTFTKVKIENTNVTNPQVGFKIATSGDAIIVDAGINHLGTKIASCPILTTSAAVTVNAETLTYPTSANIYNSKGAILATFTADSYNSGMGNVVGSSTVGLATSSSYTCQAKDGTNTVNGAAIIPIGSMKIGMAWDSASGNMYALGETGIEATGVYDGNLGLATIGILPDVDGYIKDVAIFKRALTNAEVINVFSS